MSTEFIYRASSDYIWRENDKLGYGSFGKVYKGHNKTTGAEVAIKTLSKSNSTVLSQHLKEIELFVSMPHHENVVKFIAKQRELVATPNGCVCNGDYVLVLELCTGGNLSNILAKPHFSNGLPDQEYIKLVTDIAAGLKHLRNHNLLHRDIKSANILKTTTDGKVFYKLCDFGTAKHSANDEPYSTIVGTMEYAPPAVYGAARHGLSRSECPFTSDLWSIGVVLYEAACARLPFSPFQGPRVNKRVMEQILQEKKGAGNDGMGRVISGVTKEGQGDTIFWSQHLPADCQLSLSLRYHVERILRYLFDYGAQDRTFERFIRMAEDLGSKDVVFALCLPQFTVQTVYVQREQRIFDALKFLDSTFTDCLFDGRLVDLESFQLQETSENQMFVLMTNEERTRDPHLVMPFTMDLESKDGINLAGDFERATCRFKTQIQQLYDYVNIAESIFVSTTKSILKQISNLKGDIDHSEKCVASMQSFVNAIANSSFLTPNVKANIEKKASNNLEIGTQIKQMTGALMSIQLASPPKFMNIKEDLKNLRITLELHGKSMNEIKSQLKNIQRQNDAMLNSKTVDSSTRWQGLLKKQLLTKWSCVIDCVNNPVFGDAQELAVSCTKTMQHNIKCLKALNQIQHSLANYEDMIEALHGEGGFIAIFQNENDAVKIEEKKKEDIGSFLTKESASELLGKILECRQVLQDCKNKTKDYKSLQ